MSSQDRVRRYTRTRRRNSMLDVDLNVAPPMPSDSQNHVGTSTHYMSQERQEGNSTLTAPIDLDVDGDDDVIIASPRGFAVAKNSSSRNSRPTIVVDLESEVPFLKKRRRLSTSHMNHNVFINLDGSDNSVRTREQISPLPLPPPKEFSFSCPVCMGPLVEEMSTKCGHIFCKSCIKASIAAQSKCPTCRRKISMKDVIRIYLPATNSA